MRRLLISLLLLAIIGGIAWWLATWRDGASATVDPWSRMPVNAAVIIATDDPLGDWERMTSTSQWWNSWERVPELGAFDRAMARLREACDGDAVLQRSVKESNAHMVLSSGADGAKALLLWSVHLDAQAAEKLQAVFGARLQEDAVEPVGPDGLGQLYVSAEPGLVIIAADAASVEEARVPVDEAHSLHADPLLAEARASLGGGSDANVLVHMERVQRLLTHWITPQALGKLEQVRGWAALDLRSRPEALLASGLLFSGADSPALMNTAALGQGRIVLNKVLPIDITDLSQAVVEDARTLVTSTVAEVDEPLFERYGAWVHGAIGVAHAGAVADSSDLAWAVFQTDDPERARTALGVVKDTLSYRGVRMMHTVDTSALAALWGERFDEFEDTWCCILADKVVFAERIHALRLSIDAFIDGNSQAQRADRATFFQRYATGSALTWWCDAVPTVEGLRPHLKEAGSRNWKDHATAWSRMSGCLLQISPEREGVLQLTACLSVKGGAVARDTSRAQPLADGNLWSVMLGAPVAAGPWLVTDHISRTQQVLVQDDKHRIALISCTGKVLWRRDLEGPVIGDVHQVDRFKNGKLQMLFNTSEKVHLIDRNGKDVERFPYALPEKASGPLNVFDYEGKKEYRVLIPTVEARLLNIDLNARAVEGWVPPRTKKTCEVPVLHLRIRGKDHLVLVDQVGEVSVLDRRGVKRYTPTLRVEAPTRLIGVRPAMDIGDCALIFTDAEDTLRSGAFSGTVRALDTPKDSLATNGVILFPAKAGPRPPIDADINLDGTVDRVSVDAEGRVELRSLH